MKAKRLTRETAIVIELFWNRVWMMEPSIWRVAGSFPDGIVD